MALSRRGVLAGLGVAPVAAQQVANQVSRAIGGMIGQKPPADGFSLGRMAKKASSSGDIAAEPTRLSSVADWWQTTGEKDARERSGYLDGIDPDLFEMKLPMSTKVRIQRQRNFERYKANRFEEMAARLLRDGYIEVWS